MTTKSNGIRAGIEKLKVQSGHKLPDQRSMITNAIARLGMEPDQKISIVNEIMGTNQKLRYDVAVKLIGKVAADRIRDIL